MHHFCPVGGEKMLYFSDIEFFQQNCLSENSAKFCDLENYAWSGIKFKQVESVERNHIGKRSTDSTAKIPKNFCGLSYYRCVLSKFCHCVVAVSLLRYYCIANRAAQFSGCNGRTVPLKRECSAVAAGVQCGRSGNAVPPAHAYYGKSCAMCTEGCLSQLLIRLNSSKK